MDKEPLVPPRDLAAVRAELGNDGVTGRVDLGAAMRTNDRHRLYVRAPHAKTLAPDRAELFSDDLPAMSARPSPSPSEHSRRVLQQQCADRGFSAKAPRGVPILGHIWDTFALRPDC